MNMFAENMLSDMATHRARVALEGEWVHLHMLFAALSKNGFASGREGRVPQ